MEREIEFLPLLGIEEVRPPDHSPPDFLGLVNEAERRLRADGGPVDAVVGCGEKVRSDAMDHSVLISCPE